MVIQSGVPNTCSSHLSIGFSVVHVMWPHSHNSIRSLPVYGSFNIQNVTLELIKLLAYSVDLIMAPLVVRHTSRWWWWWWCTYLLTSFLPSFMVQDIIWKAVTQLVKKYPAFLWNPKVHHRVHKSSPLDPILSQLNPVRPIDPSLPKVHLNVILPPNNDDSSSSSSSSSKLLN
jgi:hypothetical protein